MQTLTDMQIHIPTHKRKHTDTYTQTCSHNKQSHSPNQFHSQASCQAAMLTKYYHNAFMSLNMQLMNGWQPVKTVKQKNCPLTVTVLDCLLYLPVSHTSVSLCLYVFEHFSPSPSSSGARMLGGQHSREEERISALQMGYLWIWRFTSSHGCLCQVEHRHKARTMERIFQLYFNPKSSRTLCDSLRNSARWFVKGILSIWDVSFSKYIGSAENVILHIIIYSYFVIFRDEEQHPLQ